MCSGWDRRFLNGNKKPPALAPGLIFLCNTVTYSKREQVALACRGEGYDGWCDVMRNDNGDMMADTLMWYSPQ